jgi:hypothetical protein
MRSMLLSLALAVSALGLMPAKPAQARPDELVGPSITSGTAIPVAHWGGHGFYRGYYGGGLYGGGLYRPYGGFYRGYYPYGGGFYRGYYPYGGGFSRRYYYGGGFSPWGGFGGWGYPGYYW